MEIPKDGKCYLAWVKDSGHVFVFWHTVLHVYTHYDDYYDERAIFDIGKEIDRLDEFDIGKDIVRWMDEKGQWHEVNNGPN